MQEDGIHQTEYRLINQVKTDVYTKISVDLMYDEYIATHVCNYNWQYKSNAYLTAVILQEHS